MNQALYVKNVDRFQYVLPAVLWYESQNCHLLTTTSLRRETETAMALSDFE